MDYSPDKRSRAKPYKTYLAGSMPLQFESLVTCPYCGESFVLMIDGSAGNQSYFEDCEICCRPILFLTEIDSDGNLISVVTRREDE